MRKSQKLIEGCKLYLKNKLKDYPKAGEALAQFVDEFSKDLEKEV